MGKNRQRASEVNDTDDRVGRIAAGDLAVLAVHRARAEWQLCPAPAEAYWLRVPAADDAIFRKLPLLGRWTADAGGRLVRLGGRVPEAVLPAEGWQALAALLPVGPPCRTRPGLPPVPIGFCLEPAADEQPATALLCRWEHFAAWAETAFADRLEALRFACCDDGRTLVAGTPPPAIPGTGYHRAGRLFLPCGWRLPDSVWPELLEDLLRLGTNRISMLHPDGSHEDIDEENLVPARRAAIRSTAIA